MPTPAIQTLLTDAQQVLNLNSLSEVRSTMAAALANANVGTPLNPNLTTQQLWDEFYLIVRQPESDIESIITNQLMKFLFSPPAPGGAGADKQVIFNDGGVLAGSANFLFNKATNLLTVTGAATITGDLTVDTSTLKVDSANNRVGIGTASPVTTFQVQDANLTGTGQIREVVIRASSDNVNNSLNSLIGPPFVARSVGGSYTPGTFTGTSGVYGINLDSSAFGRNMGLVFYSSTQDAAATEKYRIGSDGIATWSNVGGVAGTAMTLNSTGLGVGTSPTRKLSIVGFGATYANINSGDNTSLVGILLGGTSTPSAGQLIYDNTANSLALFTSGASRLLIDSSGSVGISRASTGNKLEAPGVGIDGRGTITGVSTVATTIYTIKQSATAAMCVVFGDDGSNGFCDIVLFLATVAPKVVSSQTLYGSPAARTYSASTTNLQLALASGTLSIRTAALSTLNT